MKKYFGFLLLTGMCTAYNNLMAEETGIDVQWRGDMSTTFQFLAHSRSNIGNLGTGVQDAILHAEIKDSKSSPLKAIIGLGVLEHFDYEGTLAPFSPIDVALHYGWIEYQTSSQSYWQMGQLQNLAGLEQGVSTNNTHILYGAINHSRSFYYPGYRTIYTTGPMQIYAEISGPEIPNDTGTSLGAQFDYGSGKLTANLTHYLDEDDNYYNLSWTHKIAMFNIGGVLDYTQLNDNPVWQDDDALAIAGYLKLNLKNRYVAVRGEYFDAGNTGVYGYEKAGVITLTYSYDITSKAFMRFEGMYAKASNYAFKDDKVFVKDQYGLTVQVGMRIGK